MHLIGENLRLVIDKLSLVRKSSILDVELALAVAFAIFKHTFVGETVGVLALAKAFDNALCDLARVRAAVRVGDLDLTMRMVLAKVSFEEDTATKHELAVAITNVHTPGPFVVFFSPVALAISDFPVAVLLAKLEVTDVLSAILLHSHTFAVDFSILDLSVVATAIAHQKDSFLIFHAIFPSTLILEERISVGVATLTVS